MTAITLISTVLVVIAVLLLFGLSPERVTKDISKLFEGKRSIHRRSNIAKGMQGQSWFFLKFQSTKSALFAAGNNKFGVLCITSVIMMILGILLAVNMKNFFLVPVLALGFALLPFLYAIRTINLFKKSVENELETAVSMITTSYIRNNSIIKAVEENLLYIGSPVKEIFQCFYDETVYVSPDVKQAIRNMQEKIDSAIFNQWCDVLIACQDNDGLRRTLTPVTGKFSMVRMVNAELKTIAHEAKREYLVMVLISAASFLFLFGLGEQWYGFLFTVFGKVLIALYLITIFITSLFVMKVAQPLEYRR